jgi:hypothetical protein
MGTPQLAGLDFAEIHPAPPGLWAVVALSSGVMIAPGGVARKGFMRGKKPARRGASQCGLSRRRDSSAPAASFLIG